MVQSNSNQHINAIIHPLAIVDPAASIGENVNIGPFCMVGPDVCLGNNVRLVSHVSLAGRTHIGDGSILYPFASIGHPPQDLKYKGEPSVVTIGVNTTIREYVTIQPGTEGGGMKTVVGDNCLLMAGVHVAHDCIVGNNVVMANYATLAGHVQVGDNVIVGGLSAIQQFVRVGMNAIIGGMSGVEKDVVPYSMILGERAHLHGVNIVGLRRHGISNAIIQRIQGLYKDLFQEESDTPFAHRVSSLRETYESGSVPEIDAFFDFVEGDSRRSFCVPKK